MQVALKKHSCWFWFWISNQRNVISNLAAEAGWDSSVKLASVVVCGWTCRCGEFDFHLFFFFYLKICFRAELINNETLLYKEMQVTPVLSLYCIIHRANHAPQTPMRKKMRSRVKSQNFCIYLFIFISCPSSKLKANHREADFHLHTLQPSNCVTRPFSNTTLAAVQSERRSKEIWFHFCLVPSKCDQAKVILVYRHTPLRWSREPTFPIPQVTFQSIKEDFTALVLWRLSLAL